MEIEFDIDDEEKVTFDKTEENEMKQIKQLLLSIPKEDLLNNAKGLCLGAAIGDSIGSYCEFTTQPISDEHMAEAMKMPGGGPHAVISGQITDDTELAICLANGLLNICNDEDIIFDSYKIGIEYKKWMNSIPFDVGACTGNTLFYGPNVLKMKHSAKNYNSQCIEKYKNEGNLSNGSIMRCMPLIVYGHKLLNNNLYKLMMEDSSLSHANDIIYVVNTMYAIGVRYLLITTNKNQKYRNLNAIDMMINYLKFMVNIKRNKSAQIVLNWYNEMEKGNELHDATNQIAFIKIAFQRIFYHLQAPSSFEKVIYSVVKEGGDTDTNACIVGGILGAYFGFDSIPNKYVDAILNCETQKTQYMSDRGMFQAKYYITQNIIETIMKKAPNNNQFKMKMYNIDDNDELDKIEYVICKQCNFIRDRNDGAQDDSEHVWYCLECWQNYDQ